MALKNKYCLTLSIFKDIPLACICILYANFMHLMRSMCITHAYHAFRAIFVTNFALIMSHEILQILCDDRIKTQNIV